MNEVLADFQLYAARVGEPLKKAGIDFHQVYALSFRIRTGTKVVTFLTGKVGIGYCFHRSGQEATHPVWRRYRHRSPADCREYFGTLAK